MHTPGKFGLPKFGVLKCDEYRKKLKGKISQ